MSCSSPQTIYALMASPWSIDRNKRYIIDQFYYTVDGGSSWLSIPLPGTAIFSTKYPGIGPQGFYNLNIAVDPTTPDIVYLSGVSVWKAIRNSKSNNWTIRDIGSNIHGDNHAFGFDPTNPFTIYAGSDGGIYKSYDGGETWSDVINEGLCITQFEYMDQHPRSDAVVLAGTQDNGTLQFRNSPVFYHAADGDGGYVAIDPEEPNNVLHEYYNPTPERSSQGGKYNSWVYVGAGTGLRGDSFKNTSLFYPPYTLDQSNSKNIAFGTDRIFLDTNQGLNGWRAGNKSVTAEGNSDYSIPLDLYKDADVSELVSAINYVNSDPGLIYIGTTHGKVFQLTKSSGVWIPRALHTSKLPSRFIWDIAIQPQDVNTIIVVMGGIGSEDKPLSHIWRGKVRVDEEVQWIDISGKGENQLPDISINAVVIESKPPHILYVGTDIGVFRTVSEDTIDGIPSWARLSQGLPNCAVFDMRLHEEMRLLRAVTHGRGMWELKLDVKNVPDVDLFVRDNVMATRRSIPSLISPELRSAFEDPFQYEDPGDSNSVILDAWLEWWMCADIKIDSPRGLPPSYQMNMDDVDYVKFENELFNRDLYKAHVNYVYTQIHNRGIREVSREKPAIIKLLYANALVDSDGNIKFPDLPMDFWDVFPNNSFEATDWKPIGETKELPCDIKTLTHTEPTILAWEWNTPPDIGDSLGLLVIVDCRDDPIPESSKKITNIEELVRNEKRIGLRLVNVIED